MPSATIRIAGPVPVPPSIGRLERVGVSTALVFILGLAFGFFIDREQFFRSYLFGWLFWLGVAVGCLGLSMLNHLTGGLWGIVPRRFHEAAARTIPFMAVLFLPIVFGSLIQILGTLFSPTIAGEGAREAVQALLLSNYLGGAAQAVLSAALGFIAAEAATMWGGAFLWTRKPGWRPTFVLVDGVQVDYSWIDDTEVVSVTAMAAKARAS